MNIDGRTPLLSDDRMRELLFTDRLETHWYFVQRVGSNETLNITIDKATGDYEEYVLDESFGQPAMYGLMNHNYGVPIR